MNEKTIKKMRRKFITIAMLTLVFVMLVMGGTIFLVNTVISIKNIRDTTSFIINNNGMIQDARVVYSLSDGIDETTEKEAPDDSNKYYNINDFFVEVFGSRNMDLELERYGFSTRYMALCYSGDYELTKIIANHIKYINMEDAEVLGEFALSSGDFGSYDNYYYQKQQISDGGYIIVFLESTEKMHQNNRLLFSALMLVSLGIMITFIVVRILSGKAIAPEIEAAERQKRFITDAGHELKTPLAVIKANTEMEEILNGESEWTQSTLKQVDRMNGLIKNLVVIARGQESKKTERKNMNISEVVADVSKTYRAVATGSGKELLQHIDEEVTLTATDAEIRQLTILLVDNAIKYCDDNGTIEVFLNSKGKRAVLRVTNSFKDGKGVDYSKFFERFYREDKSRNIDKGGYGIGLSIAEELIHSYGGSISVSWNDGVICFTCILKGG